MSWVFHPIPSNHLIQIIDLHKTTRHQKRRNNDTKLIIEYFFSVFPLTWNRNVKNGLIAVMEKKSSVTPRIPFWLHVSHLSNH